MIQMNPKVRDIGQHVHSFLTADRFLGVATERKLANNTKVLQIAQSCYYGNCAIGVMLHRTIIVKYYQSGHIELNSGGYQTVTTKQRINELLPPGWRLNQKKYNWTVTTPAGTFEFESGMVFDANGNTQRKTHIGASDSGYKNMGGDPTYVQSSKHRSNPPRDQRYADIGIVSEGTLRTEDLIDAYSDTIVHVRGIKFLSKLERQAKDEGWDEDAILESLIEVMNELAPPYSYFGSSEGDGALFGFWPDIEGAQQDDDVITVEDTSEVPKGFSGYVLQINDHGNATLYSAIRGKLREVWSVV